MGQPFDFWVGEGMGDFRKIYPANWFRGKNNSCKEIPGGKSFCIEEKYFSLLIVLEKKILHRQVVNVSRKNYITRGLGKKILNQTKSPIKSHYNCMTSYEYCNNWHISLVKLYSQTVIGYRFCSNEDSEGFGKQYGTDYLL